MVGAYGTDGWESNPPHAVLETASPALEHSPLNVPSGTRHTFPWRGARGSMPNRNCTGASRASTSCRRRAAFAGRSLYLHRGQGRITRNDPRHGADGRRDPRLPGGHLHRPALFAPWRVMWRPVFPGCHTHSGGPSQPWSTRPYMDRNPTCEVGTPSRIEGVMLFHQFRVSDVRAGICHPA